MTRLWIVGLYLLGCSTQSARRAVDVEAAPQAPDVGAESDPGTTVPIADTAAALDATPPDAADGADSGDAGDASDAEPETRPIPPPTWATSDGRIVAIGDVHGDIEAARKALTAAGVIDAQYHWSGGHTVVVQVGDQLDRGDDEREILDWFEVLADEAHTAGGAFYALIGNHEQMNAQLDFRYVTDGGWTDFADIMAAPGDPLLQDLAPNELGRGAAFRPGGPYATLLAGHNVVMVVDTTLFVHGGILPHHVTYGLDELNLEHQRWLLDAGDLSAIWGGEDSPLWDRSYSDETTAAECAVLADVLDALSVERIVVAHTVQADGINSVCDGQAVRVDVGMASHYGGVAQALEILGGQLNVLK